ncbi:MAG: hypothetical protein MPJ24_05205 [Pirellulaceae bacterium]|nr:hypothetical protein [Pirellulaceae bacterium]
MQRRNFSRWLIACSLVGTLCLSGCQATTSSIPGMGWLGFGGTEEEFSVANLPDTNLPGLPSASGTPTQLAGNESNPFGTFDSSAPVSQNYTSPASYGGPSGQAAQAGFQASTDPYSGQQGMYDGNYGGQGGRANNSYLGNSVDNTGGGFGQQGGYDGGYNTGFENNYNNNTGSMNSSTGGFGQSGFSNFPANDYGSGSYDNSGYSGGGATGTGGRTSSWPPQSNTATQNPWGESAQAISNPFATGGNTMQQGPPTTNPFATQPNTTAQANLDWNAQAANSTGGYTPGSISRVPANSGMANPVNLSETEYQGQAQATGFNGNSSYNPTGGFGQGSGATANYGGASSGETNLFGQPDYPTTNPARMAQDPFGNNNLNGFRE